MHFNQFNCRNCNHSWFRYTDEDNGPEFCAECGYLNAPVELPDSDEPITELDELLLS